MKVNAGCCCRYISSAFICIVINRVFIYLGIACVKLMSSVGESRGQIGGALDIGKDMGG